MGTGLRKLVKSCKEVSGGVKGLSERRIKKLTDYYRNAIIKNSTKSQDSVYAGLLVLYDRMTTVE